MKKKPDNKQDGKPGEDNETAKAIVAKCYRMSDERPLKNQDLKRRDEGRILVYEFIKALTTARQEARKEVLDIAVGALKEVAELGSSSHSSPVKGLPYEEYSDEAKIAMDALAKLEKLNGL